MKFLIALVLFTVMLIAPYSLNAQIPMENEGYYNNRDHPENQKAYYHYGTGYYIR